MFWFALLLTSTTTARVFVDPGHGVGTNSGLVSADCESEADINLRIARRLALQLRKRGFAVKLSRTNGNGPSYAKRVRTAERWNADVLLSIHADARGWATGTCPTNASQPGFSILYADWGPIMSERASLARGVARAMSNVGFTAYDGFDYGGLFELDPEAGVFRDRRRLYLTRKPKMPSIIIETHHALHPGEVAHWRKHETLDRFANAVAAGVLSHRARVRNVVK